MATPFLAGLAVAAAALAGRYSIQAWQAYKARPVVPRMRRFYEGGFQQTMTRREAALILGVRKGFECSLTGGLAISLLYFGCFSAFKEMANLGSLT
ncbi:mitochondrial import inner membrane translocase subunit TIM14-3-like isoform X2 [Asparagus officinalis]|uniref:mitochondrial import inner membrane translocase subunit TIM14-3-like isoform X2 n=1 Tax=Asparagus officinalis TaxID=4686 RepID=UPI00098E55B5|nr:mitochondrial import inner membrane translocase subunit TIM14-3-like isoform X2 [Asparagus officinalis]